MRGAANSGTESIITYPTRCRVGSSFQNKAPVYSNHKWMRFLCRRCDADWATLGMGRRACKQEETSCSVVCEHGWTGRR